MPDRFPGAKLAGPFKARPSGEGSASGRAPRGVVRRFIDRHVVAVWIADNERAHARAVVRAWGLDDRRALGLSPPPGGVEIINREPQQEPIAGRARAATAQGGPAMVTPESGWAPMVHKSTVPSLSRTWLKTGAPG